MGVVREVGVGPPWELRPDTVGSGTNVSRFTLVIELMVLMSEMALAPARFAARATAVTSVMLGVSLTMTGMVAASMTQPVIFSATAGCWPTAEPMPRSHMPWGQP